ncbi:MAG: DUF2147 domain-containing protein [Sporichthyaceae bacterium]
MFLSLRSVGIALLSMSVLSLQAASALTPDVTGIWLTDDGEGAVEIRPCGDARCGQIVWLKQPLDAHGQPLHDVNNPSAAARSRTLCGTEILSGLRRQDDGSWDGGSIYDPEEGKTYTVTLKPVGDAKLEVTGYVGIKALSETVTWTRRDTQLTRCNPDTKSRAAQ